jgi:hypothetical protein
VIPRRRLYRGLKHRYRREAVGEGQGDLCGTDFTDCPLTALDYAHGRQGVLLVLDVPEAADARVSEEFWFRDGPRRLMLWGEFDRFLVAEIPARELRAQIRRKGVVTEPRQYKSQILADYIDRRVAAIASGTR